MSHTHRIAALQQRGPAGLALSMLASVLVTTGLTLSSPARAQSVTLYDAAGFTSFATGPIDAIGQNGWTGLVSGGAALPEIVASDLQLAIRLSVPATGTPAPECRAVLMLPAPITISSYSRIWIEFDVTTDADGDNLRQNLYFDVDPVPNPTASQTQVVRSDGWVRLIRGGYLAPVGGNGTYRARIEFDRLGAFVWTSYGPSGVDTPGAGWLQNKLADQIGEDPDGNPGTLDAISFALVANQAGRPAHDMLIDNVVIRGVRAEVLDSWTEVDPGADDWEIVRAGSTLTMREKTGSSSVTAGFVVSDFYLPPHATVGVTAGVIDNYDDDFFGIAFGYRDAQHFYLLDWKQNTAGDAEEGIKLKRVSGVWTDYMLWDGTGSAVTTLAYQDGGWADYTSYRFEFEISPGSVVIRRNGQILFSIEDAGICGGRIALYGYSQREIRFSDLSVHTRGPRSIQLTSGMPATALPVTGTPAEQLSILNAGPAAYPPSAWQPVVRHSGTTYQFRSGFACGSGGIIAESGAIAILPGVPGSVRTGAQESSTHIQAFREWTGVLSAAGGGVPVDIQASGTYWQTGQLEPFGAALLPTGVQLTSHFLHFDTVGESDQRVRGSITFDTEIQGVSVTSLGLSYCEIILGFSGASFPLYPPSSESERALELGNTPETGDSVIVSADRRTLTFISHVDRHSDQVRVFTLAGPPDPLSQPYVDAIKFIDEMDEVTLNNCGSAFYRWTFDLPANAEKQRLWGLANVDDVAAVFLNGVSISPALLASDAYNVDRVAGCAPLMSAPSRDYFAATDATLFRAGVNELVFAVAGDAGLTEPTGVEFSATIEFGEAAAVAGVGPRGATAVELRPPWPNPSRGATTIAFSLARPGEVEVAVHDVAGRLVATVASGWRSAGSHLVAWDGRGRELHPVAAGIYYVRLAHASGVEARRIAILR